MAMNSSLNQILLPWSVFEEYNVVVTLELSVMNGLHNVELLCNMNRLLV